MKLRTLFVTTCALFSIFGCKAEEAIPYNYVILIGQETAPHWQSISVGDEFGESLSLQVFSKSPFGLIRVIWDGVEEAKFDQGGVVLARNSGRLTLVGELETDLKLLLTKKLESGRWVLLKKEILKQGELSYALSLGHD